MQPWTIAAAHHMRMLTSCVAMVQPQRLQGVYSLTTSNLKQSYWEQTDYAIWLSRIHIFAVKCFAGP